ncbi:hypothetical protein Leryth_018614 [Lithospermum erythrorhizon]|nr:hypothetical protein Leryth_018614 [Lithospermum erythrorhizon]
MSCLALALQPANGPDILLQSREWFPPSRALMALSAFRETRLAFSALKVQERNPNNQESPFHPHRRHDDTSLGCLVGTNCILFDPVIPAYVGKERLCGMYRVVYRLVNSIYVLGVTTADDNDRESVCNNVFECIGIVNQAKKYCGLAAMLASMHGDGIAKMVHSAIHTENKIRGADSWGRRAFAEHEGGVVSFSNALFELPQETLQAGDEVASTTILMGDEKDQNKLDESEGVEQDPFAASDKLNQPESLVDGFKKDKEQGFSDVAKQLLWST